MNILFFSENFPPETNAAATRVFERAVYWAKWGHNVTVVTCAPNFPHGRLFEDYRNAWYQTEMMSGIKVVRVKTYIAANQGVIRRSLDFFSFLITGAVAGVFRPAYKGGQFLNGFVRFDDFVVGRPEHAGPRPNRRQVLPMQPV